MKHHEIAGAPITPAGARWVVLEVSGGVLTGITTSDSDVRVAVIDWDDIAFGDTAKSVKPEIGYGSLAADSLQELKKGCIELPHA